jgi:hypothetical protein
MLTRTQEDLWSEVEQLSHLCDRRLPESDPIRRTLRSAVYIGDDDNQPSVKTRRSARHAFYAMPPAKLARVMAGWSIDTKRVTREHLLACIDSEGIHRMLTLQVCRSADHRARVDACQDYEFGAGFPIVRVIIGEGSSREEALEQLGRIRQMIEEKWESLITQPYTAHDAGDDAGTDAAADHESDERLVAVADNEGFAMACHA